MCYTYAVFSILTGNESFVTNAVVSVIGVDALAIFTNSFLLAFVCFAAFVCLGGQLQRKEPIVLTHWPPSQRAGIASHSSISVNIDIQFTSFNI